MVTGAAVVPSDGPFATFGGGVGVGDGEGTLRPTPPNASEAPAKEQRSHHGGGEIPERDDGTAPGWRWPGSSRDDRLGGHGAGAPDAGIIGRRHAGTARRDAGTARRGDRCLGGGRVQR